MVRSLWHPVIQMKTNFIGVVFALAIMITSLHAQDSLSIASLHEHKLWASFADTLAASTLPEIPVAADRQHPLLLQVGIPAVTKDSTYWTLSALALAAAGFRIGYPRGLLRRRRARRSFLSGPPRSSGQVAVSAGIGTAPLAVCRAYELQATPKPKPRRRPRLIPAENLPRIDRQRPR